jgi:hypothetical protein
MKTNPNDLAYPAMAQNYLHIGLTKREYFAAMALQGMLSYDRTRHLDDISRWSVEAADALINALNETK